MPFIKLLKKKKKRILQISLVDGEKGQLEVSILREEEE